uniref:Uncharacterized protein n=1 Tax=Arion vulgaris TaxID=1028688 RepID=A0A0B7ACD7_9EUPU
MLIVFTVHYMSHLSLLRSLHAHATLDANISLDRKWSCRDLRMSLLIRYIFPTLVTLRPVCKLASYYEPLCDQDNVST